MKNKTIDQLLDIIYYAHDRWQYRTACNMPYHGQDEQYVLSAEMELTNRGYGVPVFFKGKELL